MKSKQRIVSRFALMLSACTFAGAAPTITNVTNAALPEIDFPPGPVHLAPRSMGTIWGSDLADFAVSTSPPWKQSLAGTEVRLVTDFVSIGNTTVRCDCDLTLDLTYASPTQINFVVPEIAFSVVGLRMVLIRNGVKYDSHADVFRAPGYVVIDTFIEDFALFSAGYDCLFSFSISDPQKCGLSNAAGPERALTAAATDASGRLISVSNPVRQGQAITLWATGLTRLAKNAQTGLIQQTPPNNLGLGVAQRGVDFKSMVFISSTGEGGNFPAITSWAGESPQFPGVNQINVTLATCKTTTKAATEKRYDIFLSSTSVESLRTGRVYLPFVVAPGDPDCQF